MKVKYWLILGVLIGLMTPTLVAAKVYQISPELAQEVRANKAAATARPSAETLFDLAMSYAYTGQIEKGWAILRKIPNYDTNFAPDVVSKYEAAIKKNPTEWRHHFKLAFGYYFLDQKDKSIVCFRRVLELDPKNAWALGFIALIKGDQGNMPEAIETAKQAIKIEPNAAALHFLLATGYAKSGNYWGSVNEMAIVGRLKAQEAVAFGD